MILKLCVACLALVLPVVGFESESSGAFRNLSVIRKVSVSAVGVANNGPGVNKLISPRFDLSDHVVRKVAGARKTRADCNIFCDKLAGLVAPMQQSLEMQGTLEFTKHGFICLEMSDGSANAPKKGNKCLQQHVNNEGDHIKYKDAQFGVRNKTAGGSHKNILRFLGRAAPTTKTAVLLMLQDNGFLPREHVAALREHGIPVLAFNAECDRDDIMLIPDERFLGSDAYSEQHSRVDEYSKHSPWESKRRVIAFRGGSQGRVPHSPTLEGLAVNDRLRVALAVRNSQSFDVGIERAKSEPLSWNRNTEGFWLIKDRDVITAMYDYKLVKEKQNIQEMMTARGLLDIDGYTNSWAGLFWKLRSNSVVVKVLSKYCEWFYNELLPGVHYLAVKSDLSNLFDVAQTLVGNNSDDAALIKIAIQATELTKRLTWSSEAEKLRRKLE